ncbi:hypothetical protein Dimus_031566, partial [Dionaea muscipula]
EVELEGILGVLRKEGGHVDDSFQVLLETTPTDGAGMSKVQKKNLTRSRKGKKATTAMEVMEEEVPTKGQSVERRRMPHKRAKLWLRR